MKTIKNFDQALRLKNGTVISDLVKHQKLYSNYLK